MSTEDQAYATIIILILASAIVLLVVDTRPLWSREKLIHEGFLNDYYEVGGSHIFHFEGDPPIAERGWLWKTFLPRNRTVALYRRGSALVVREVSKPSIGA